SSSANPCPRWRSKRSSAAPASDGSGFAARRVRSMPWYHAVVESGHDLQNPTSREKILELGDRLGLGPASEVLDLGSGRAGPALVLAGAFGCRITCVERAEEFDDAARRRVRDAGLDTLIECVRADASAYPLETGSFDVVMCLGASFIWNGMARTL